MRHLASSTVTVKPSAVIETLARCEIENVEGEISNGRDKAEGRAYVDEVDAAQKGGEVPEVVHGSGEYLEHDWSEIFWCWNGRVCRDERRTLGCSSAMVGSGVQGVQRASHHCVALSR